MKKQINKGSISLEMIAIIVCVILISVLGLRTFGEQISSTINETTNTTRNTTDNVLSKNNNGNTPTPGIDMSNINIADETTTIAAGDFSTSGNIVKINDQYYRVLQTEGTQAKVVKLASGSSSLSSVNVPYTKFGVHETFGSYTGFKYAESNLDNIMNSFYDGLSTSIQNAIVPQILYQSYYATCNPENEVCNYNSSYKNYNPETDSYDYQNYSLIKKGSALVGERKAYVIDIDDIISYLGSNPTPEELTETFFYNVKGNYVDTNISMWLRSASDEYYNYNYYAYYIDKYSGLRKAYNNTVAVIPEFVIDLSLLS